MAKVYLARVLLSAFLAIAFAGAASAQATPSRAPVSHVDVSALPTMAPPAPGAPTTLDPVKATNAYLARVSGPARALSDSYFEGGYVLKLVDVIYALAVAALLLWSRVSAWMRDQAERITRSRFWQVPIYVALYTVATTILGFPLTLYEDFFRERAYRLLNQTFIQWFGDFAIGFGLDLLFSIVALTLIYAFIRRMPRTWWIWATVLSVAGLLVQIMITPVFIDPLLNHYKPLPDGPVKQSIVRQAYANGIPSTNIYEFDASRQSNRISANVSGLFGTTQISMTDNLLKNCTPQEIQAVLGHEMGHYVLDHPFYLSVLIGLVYLVAFVMANAVFRWLTGIFGGNWDVRTIDDPAGLPVLAAIAAVFFLLATPVTNTIIRTAEHQADMFGLNAARQPDAFATVTLKLSTYRKLDPSPLEEFIFYDHPSGRTRIYDAMRWKAAHIDDPDIKAGPVSPQ